MRITIPDTLADRYEAYAKDAGVSLDETITRQLDRFSYVKPFARALVVPTADAERVLGGMPILDGPNLLRRMGQLASLHFHDIRLDFTASQLAELQWRADRQGKTVEQLAEEIVAELVRGFFWGRTDDRQMGQDHPVAR